MWVSPSFTPSVTSRIHNAGSASSVPKRMPNFGPVSANWMLPSPVRLVTAVRVAAYVHWMGLTLAERRAVTEATANRYQLASKRGKGRILDEVVRQHRLAP
jgi:hypothetical protein